MQGDKEDKTSVPKEILAARKKWAEERQKERPAIGGGVGSEMLEEAKETQKRWDYERDQLEYRAEKIIKNLLEGDYSKQRIPASLPNYIPKLIEIISLNPELICSPSRLLNHFFDTIFSDCRHGNAIRRPVFCLLVDAMSLLAKIMTPKDDYSDQNFRKDVEEWVKNEGADYKKSYNGWYKVEFDRSGDYIY